jgi:hypothetical protein
MSLAMSPSDPPACQQLSVDADPLAFLGLGDRQFAQISTEADVVGAGESQDRIIPNGDEGHVVVAEGGRLQPRCGQIARPVPCQ